MKRLFILLLGLSPFLFVQTVFGQGDKDEDVAQYSYDEKGIEAWEMGGGFVVPIIHGDIKPRFGYGLNFSATRGINGYLKGRGELYGGVAKGRNWYMNSGFHTNSAWNGENNAAADYTDQVAVIYNFRTIFVNMNISAEFNATEFAQRQGWLNLPPDRKWDVHLTLGGGALFYNASVNALNENQEPYDFMEATESEVVIPSKDANKKGIKSSLNDMMDNSYETPAQTKNSAFTICDEITKKNGQTIHNRCHVSIVPLISAGLNVTYQVTRNIRVGLRFNQNKSFNDYIDGHHFNDHYNATHDDWLSFTHLNLMYDF